MAITNPRAIKYIEDEVRPLSERMRDLDYDIQAALVTWHAQISANVPNDAGEAVEDGRDSEGVSRLTGADVNNLITQLSAYKTQMDAAGVRDVVSKPTIRSRAE